MRRIIWTLLVVLVFLIPVSANSFSTGKNAAAPVSFWRISWANDIAYQTDFYFTNGLSLSWYSGKSLSRFFSLFHPPYSRGNIMLTSFSLTQDIFTPQNVHSAAVQYNDRPYASYLLFGHSQTTIDPIKRYIRTTSLQAGVLGKLSGGEKVQNGIHELLPASQPVDGWQYQLASDIALNYGLTLEKNLIWTHAFRLNGNAAGRVGLPYTDAAASLSWEIGRLPAYYGYPYIAGNKAWYYYLRTEAGMEYRLYDATIQGGWLQKNNVHTLSFITALRYSFGNALVIGRYNFQVELGHRWKSAEFSGAVPHGYGYITFQFGF